MTYRVVLIEHVTPLIVNEEEEGEGDDDEGADDEDHHHHPTVHHATVHPHHVPGSAISSLHFVLNLYQR